MLGLYRLERCIGIGGMGEVYEARHTGLGKRVALKALRPSATRDPVERLRFQREAETASQLTHPHVVDITDMGEHEGTPFFVMEYLEGETLSERLKREPRLTTQQLVDLLLPVVAALGHAHNRRVVHRDVKPGNILLCRSAAGELVPKVLDFGICKPLDGQDGQELTVSASLIGTPNYMAPEQALGAKFVDERADQYAVGAVLYEGVTGRRPHSSPDETFLGLLNSIASGEVDRPSLYAPSLPAGLEEVIAKAMERDADARFPSMRELGRALLPFASERGRLLYQPAISALTSVELGDETLLDISAVTGSGTLATGDSTRHAYAGQTHGNSGRAPPWREPRHLVLGALAVSLIASAALILSGRGASGESPPADVAGTSVVERPVKLQIDTRVTPSDAVIELDGRPVGQGRVRTTLERDGSTHGLRFTAPGYDSQLLTFTDTPPPAHVTLLPVQPTPAPPDAQLPEAAAAASAVGGAAERTFSGATRAAAQPPPRAASSKSQTPAPASLPTDNIDPWAQ